MTAAVFEFPRQHAASAEPPGLNLSEQEVRDASGGYTQAARQLRELHARGFTRAYIPKVGRKRVILERAHYDAVVRGHFAAPAPQEPAARPPAAPDRAGLRAFFGQKRKK